MAIEEGGVTRVIRIKAVFGLALAMAACAGDTRETGELQFRRDGWDVQNVAFTVRPEGVPSWCHVENDRIAMNVHLVPGLATLPVRGTELRVVCWNTRGMTGQAVLEREEAGRWPASVEVRLQPDRRMAQVSPEAAAVAPYRSRAR